MANPTSNFGWQMPTPTDLVTDLPADFEVFGQAVDTSLADLKGGSTGQVLSKNSNTDMDFVWVTSDDANAIQNAIVDAKGDLIAATAADTPARLAVGTNGQVLTADSTAATGLAWAAPSSGAVSVIQTITTTGSASNVSFTSIPSTYKNLRIVYSATINAGTWEGFLMRLNNDTGSNYDRQTLYGRAGTAGAAETFGSTSIQIGIITQTYGSSGEISIPAYKDTTFDKFAFNTFYAKSGTGTTGQWSGLFGGSWRNTSAVTQIDLFPESSRTFINGSTFTLYGES